MFDNIGPELAAVARRLMATRMLPGISAMSKQEEEAQVKADVDHITRHMVNQFKVAFRDLARNESFQRLGLAGSLNDDQITDGVHAFLLAVKKTPAKHPN